MAKKKTGKLKRKSGGHPSKNIPPQAAVRKIPYDLILTCLVAAYLLYYLACLFASLGEVNFWADENVHAYISSVIFETAQLPESLPGDIYGGFEYSYPPFFHILNAVVLAIAGFPALKFTNILLLIMFMGAFFFLLWKHYGIDVALIACLLISLSPTLAENTVRFMTEMLSMTLVFASFFFWLVAIKSGKAVYAIGAGLSTGLLMLSKQIGIVVLGYYCFLLLWFLFKRHQHVKLQLYVISTAILVFIPYLAWAIFHRVEIFGFVGLFLGNQPEWASKAVTSFRTQASAFKEFALLFYGGNGVVICVSILFPLVHAIRTRARDFPHNCVLLMVVYLSGVMIVWHITNSRHTIILLPLVVFLAGHSLQQLITNRAILRTAIVLLLLGAVLTTYNMPNYRQMRNAPREALKMAQIIQREHQSGKKTLVIQAFDYLMITDKPVIWPFPNLKNTPVDLFDKQGPAQLYDLLKRYNIDLVLIDMRFVTNSDEFMGRNYPLPFIRNCEILDQMGMLRLKALSGSKALILLEVV